MQSHHIPDRSSGRHAQQYAETTDAARLTQILTESVAIALQSKTPDTALDRRDLALEAYHQLRELNAHQAVHETIVAMVTDFPIRVLVNEANGLVAKAAKIKTPRRKVDLLRQALLVLQNHGCGLPSDGECQRLARTIADDVASIEAAG